MVKPNSSRPTLFYFSNHCVIELTRINFNNIFFHRHFGIGSRKKLVKKFNIINTLRNKEKHDYSETTSFDFHNGIFDFGNQKT